MSNSNKVVGHVFNKPTWNAWKQNFRIEQWTLCAFQCAATRCRWPSREKINRTIYWSNFCVYINRVGFFDGSISAWGNRWNTKIYIFLSALCLFNLYINYWYQYKYLSNDLTSHNKTRGEARERRKHLDGHSTKHNWISCIYH